MDENKLFPGRENYTGPTKGPFGLLHHSELMENSENVMERVDYVKNYKPRDEIPIRLHNMIYLGGCEAAVKYVESQLAASNAENVAYHECITAKSNLAGLTEAEADDKVRAAIEKYRAATLAAFKKADEDKVVFFEDVLLYIKAQIPDCAWEGTTIKGALKFPEE